jgi:hypothetical protein
MTEHEAIGRVRRGAELLDRVHPGWAAKVPADGRLMMWDYRTCVWGWAFGSFGRGQAALGRNMRAVAPYIPDPHLEEYFGVYVDRYTPDYRAACEVLADAWRAAIRARGGGGGLPRTMEGPPCSS